MNGRSPVLALLLLALACSSVPKAPEPGEAVVWGFVTLDPREGVETGDGGSYGDRRLYQSELVDYSRPGFAVVYLDESAASPASASLHIRDTRVSPRIEPAHAVASMGGTIAVANAGGAPRTVSCPAAKLVRRLEPGESVELSVTEPGEYAIYLLDVPGSSATVLATPGRHAVASESGRWQIRDLAPGRHRLRTWHPRFPPTSRWVELEPDGIQRVDIELGVEHGGEVSDVTP